MVCRLLSAGSREEPSMHAPGIGWVAISRSPTGHRLLHSQSHSAVPLRALGSSSSSYSPQSPLLPLGPCSHCNSVRHCSWLGAWCSSRELGVRGSSKGSRNGSVGTLNYRLLTAWCFRSQQSLARWPSLWQIWRAPGNPGTSS